MSYGSLTDIDWFNWEPVEHGTLLYIFDAGRVLLIKKKRGLGAGKINGPGGRIENNETAVECALRETREEVGLRAIQPSQIGILLRLPVFCTYRTVSCRYPVPLVLWTGVNILT